jgi:hypothetical protein
MRSDMIFGYLTISSQRFGRIKDEAKPDRHSTDTKAYVSYEYLNKTQNGKDLA